MSDKALRYIIYIGLFLVPFTPLIVAESLFFPFITGKAFFFRAIVTVVVLAFSVLALRNSEYRPKYSHILGALSVFLLGLAVSTILAENSFKAFWSNFERMEGYITLLYLSAYFLVLGTMFKSQSMWNSLLATSLGASAIMAIYSFFQLAGKITINQGGVRVDGTLGNASYLGIYMVFHIFFAGLLFMRYRQGWQRILLALVGLANLVVLYFTATRGSILGLLGGAFISFAYLTLKSEKGDKIRKVALAGAVGLLILFSGFLAVRDSGFVQKSPVLSRFASLSFSEIKTQGRYFVWPMAWRGALERPIFGWGQEGFNYVFNKNYDSRMYTQEPWFDRTHNAFLDWLVAGGFVGLLAYLSILVALLYSVVKANDNFLTKGDKAVIFGLLGAYLFHNLFVFDQISSYILFFTLLAYGHAHSSDNAPGLWQRFSTKLSRIFDRENSRPIYESIAVILAVAILYFAVIGPYLQNRRLMSILALNSQGQVGTVEDYKKPLAKNGIGFSEALEHLSRAVVTLNANPNVSAEMKGELFSLIDSSFKKQLAIAPNDARYQLFYGLFLSGFGQVTEAEPVFARALELSPNKQSMYFELVGALISQGRAKEAIPYAKKAYELEPNFFEAKFIYGLTAIAGGERQLADQIFSDVPTEKLIFDDRLVTVLLMAGRVDEIIEIAKQRIALDPNNNQHRITLAAAYLQANRRSEAVVAIREIIRLDPSFKERGEYYIKEIEAGRNP